MNATANAAAPASSGDRLRNFSGTHASGGAAGNKPRQLGLFDQLLISTAPVEPRVDERPIDSRSRDNDTRSIPEADSTAPTPDEDRPNVDEEQREEEVDDVAAANAIAATSLTQPPTEQTVADADPAEQAQAGLTQATDEAQATDDTLARDAGDESLVADPQDSSEAARDLGVDTLASSADKSTSADPLSAATGTNNTAVADEVSLRDGERAEQGTAPESSQPEIDPNKAVQPVAKVIEVDQTAEPASDPVEDPNAGAEDEPTTAVRRGDRSTRGQRQKWYERTDEHQPPNGAVTDQRPGSAENDSPAIVQAVDASLPNADTEQATATVSLAEQAAAPETTIIENPVFLSPSAVITPLDEAVTGGFSGTAPAIAEEALGPATGSTSQRIDAGPSRQAGPEISHKSTAMPGTADGTVDLSQAEKVRMIQRVARSFNRLGPDGGEVNLRLHPPELGSLNVQVRMEGRSMTAKLTTESVAAREVILESLPTLKSRLAEQGIEVALFQVDVADNGNADAGLGRGDQQAFEQREGNRQSNHSAIPYQRQPRHALTQPIDAIPRPITPTWPTTTSPGIDLRV